MILLDGELLNFSDSRSFYGGLATLWIFSAAVSAMARPSTRDNNFYQWLYRFTHLLAANLDKVTVAEFRSSPAPEDEGESAQHETGNQEKHG